MDDPTRRTFLALIPAALGGPRLIPVDAELLTRYLPIVSELPEDRDAWTILQEMERAGEIDFRHPMLLAYQRWLAGPPVQSRSEPQQHA